MTLSLLRRLDRWTALLACVFGVYLILALGTALTQRPWSDEAWFASPALNLATKGYMGTSVFEPGRVWPDLDQRTYWQPPLYFLAQIPWYAVWGFSLLSMRSLSILWGVVLLIALFFLVKRITGSKPAAVIAVMVEAFDPVFLRAAATGRMDMMASALGFAGLAAYVVLRERGLDKALLISHSLIVAAGLTHPNGILAFAGLLCLIVTYDRRRIRVRHVLLSLVPYIVGGLGWGVYIAQDPQAFAAQFSANMSGRLGGLTSVLTGFQYELAERYLGGYGFFSASSLSKAMLIIPFCYVQGFASLLINLSRRLRKLQGSRVLLLLTGLYFVLMTVVIGNKEAYYLPHIIPLWAAVFAVWVVGSWKSRFIRLEFVGLLLLMIVLSAHQIADFAREYADYVDTTAYLQNRPTGLIMGSAELAFRLGFDSGLVDDTYLGYYSGKKPQVIVVEGRYRRWFAQFQDNVPPAYQYIMELLNHEFQDIHHNAVYTVYVRRPGS